MPDAGASNQEKLLLVLCTCVRIGCAPGISVQKRAGMELHTLSGERLLFVAGIAATAARL